MTLGEGVVGNELMAIAEGQRAYDGSFKLNEWGYV